MPRLTPIDPATATGEAKELLDAIQAAFGRTPNSFRVMAGNPAVLKGWIELNGALGKTLPRKLGEQIAIAIAEQNGCAYCLSAHTRSPDYSVSTRTRSTTTARESPTSSGSLPRSDSR